MLRCLVPRCPTVRTFPFSAVVGSEEMALALILTTVAPEIGGVLVRGEKGTAKTTMVRALAHVLPPVAVVAGCRFSCDPDDPDPRCPDGPHPDARSTSRPARLVELPVGATEDRVIGSLDLQQALGAGQVSYEPGLLAAAHRGILYVDEVNLLHDHLVDLLLDAAAIGRSTVEREGVSVAHASQLVLIGTMNPEEGELRPQLLDRFGLTVEIAAPRDPQLRAEVIRRRMAFDADPEAFVATYAYGETALRQRIRTAREQLPGIKLTDDQLVTIAEICAAFDVDGMRADIVTARAAVAHAAWHARAEVTIDDIRAAARLALPHRRRRNPFDAPGLDEDLLDQLLPEDEPEPDPDGPSTGSGNGDAATAQGTGTGDGSGSTGTGTAQGTGTLRQAQGTRVAPGATLRQAQGPSTGSGNSAGSGAAYRTRLFTAAGIGAGEAGRRSRALTPTGRTVGAAQAREAHGKLHLPATIQAAAPEQRRRGRGTRRTAAAGRRRPATRRHRGARVQPDPARGRRLRVDGGAAPDDRGEDRGAVPAAGCLPAPGQGRPGHLPRLLGRARAAAHLLDRRGGSAVGRAVQRGAYAAGRRSAPRRRDTAGRAHPRPPPAAAAGGGHRRSGDFRARRRTPFPAGRRAAPRGRHGSLGDRLRDGSVQPRPGRDPQRPPRGRARSARRGGGRPAGRGRPRQRAA